MVNDGEVVRRRLEGAECDGRCYVGFVGLRWAGLDWVGWRGAGNWAGGCSRGDSRQVREATAEKPVGPGQDLQAGSASDSVAGSGLWRGARRARGVDGSASKADGGARHGRTITARSGETQTHDESFGGEVEGKKRAKNG